MAKPTLLVLAAGMGSRYGGLKQLDTFGPNGETIIDYSIYDAVRAGFGKIVMVIRKSIEEDFKQIFLKKYSEKIDLSYVLQELEYVPQGATYNPQRVKPWGTAHAIMMAEDAIKEPFCVINGDDFYGADSYVQMNEFLKGQKADSPTYCMVGYKLSKTLSDYGFVARGICETDEQNMLLKVTERTQIKRIGSEICFKDPDGVDHPLSDDKIASMNFWGFTPAFFKDLKTIFADFIAENGNDLKAEIYIPIVVSQLLDQKIATLKVLSSNAEWFGVTYKEDRPYVVDRLKNLHEMGEYPSPLN